MPEVAPAGSALTVAARHDLYGDAFNERAFMRPGAAAHRGSGRDRRRRASTGLTRGWRAGVGGASRRLRQLQTGFARSYALSMLGGAVLVVAAILVVRRAGERHRRWLTVLWAVPMVGAGRW